MIAIEGLVKKIDCFNFYSKDCIRYVFKSGYPGIDKQNENYYYQVLTEGKIELLARRFKYIRVSDKLHFVGPSGRFCSLMQNLGLSHRIINKNF